MKVLVLNSGSSSIKFELIDVDANRRLGEGGVERIGEADALLRVKTAAGAAPYRESIKAADHRAGLEHVLDALIKKGLLNRMADLDGIGHRIVHGGDMFSEPVIVDDIILAQMHELSRLAPLHSPAGIAGIEVMRQLAPGVPQVAVFDTAFHQTLPPEAYSYALPPDLSQRYGLRRYGFHGTSHRYVSQAAAQYLARISHHPSTAAADPLAVTGRTPSGRLDVVSATPAPSSSPCAPSQRRLDALMTEGGEKSGLVRPENEINLITLHLGNGVSATAVRNGRSVDTSMGFTPLEGLVMGTRCGDIDPAIPLFLVAQAGYSPAQVDELLNRNSGLKGLCGVNDMREVLRLADEGDESAELALTLFCYRIRKYIGAYFAVLGKLDALVFTAGIGEYSPQIRRRCCEDLQHLGIRIDKTRNAEAVGKSAEISPAGAQTRVLVIPTDEELEIAHATRDCLAKT